MVTGAQISQHLKAQPANWLKAEAGCIFILLSKENEGKMVN